MCRVDSQKDVVKRHRQIGILVVNGKELSVFGLVAPAIFPRDYVDFMAETVGREVNRVGQQENVELFQNRLEL